MRFSSFQNLKIVFLVSLILFPWPIIVSATTTTAKVVRVLDGDTIEVLDSQHPERIRLSGIDCPEKAQAFGQKAKHAASALAFGKYVTVQTHGHDKYKRIIKEVILPNGMNLNQELVKQGWCRQYQNYASRDTVLAGLAHEARMARLGLWARTLPRQGGTLGCCRFSGHHPALAPSDHAPSNEDRLPSSQA